MTFTLTSRKTARQQIATLLSQISTFVAVYDHQTKDFGRKSPVAMVWGDATASYFEDAAYDWHRLRVAILWARDDADATEDYLDDLSQAVRQKLLDNYEVAGQWSDLDLTDFSQVEYLMIDNVQYRAEEFGVAVKSLLTVS